MEDLGLDFSVEDVTFGRRATQELIDGGADIPVTAANRMHYILLMADWHLNGRLNASAGSFASGMAQVQQSPESCLCQAHSRVHAPVAALQHACTSFLWASMSATIAFQISQSR